MITNHNQQIYGWLEKIEANVARFKSSELVSPEEKLEFIQHQYHLVMLIHRALNGQVIFVGARPINNI
jgi:hypothetical protein